MTVPVSAETLRRLMDAGIEGQALLDIVQSIERDNQQKPRSAGADRQARYRERKKSGVTRDVTSNATNDVTDVTPPHSRVVDKQLTTDKPKKEEQKKAPSAHDDLEAFKAELAPLLDPERIEAIIRVRVAKKALNTSRTGHLLFLALSKLPDPVAAADEMALRGWLTAKPDWMESRGSRAGPAYRKPLTTQEALLAKLKECQDEPAGEGEENSGASLDASRFPRRLAVVR